jgi:probable rRNA maturation factor
MQEGPFSDITPDLLGDVVISVDTAHREAEEAGMAMQERLNQLLIHGILHLVGYDHVNSNQEAKAMERKSNELIKRIQKEV